MFTVVAAEPKDLDGIADLLDELDRYYGGTATQPRDQASRQINDALFSEFPAGYALIVRDGDSLAGFASYSFLWPAAGLTRSLYLKELYVAQSHRGQGLGKLLMTALLDTATKHGCSRVEWTADDDNPDAQAFYAALNLPQLPSKIFYRASSAQMSKQVSGG